VAHIADCNLEANPFHPIFIDKMESSSSKTTAEVDVTLHFFGFELQHLSPQWTYVMLCLI